MRQEPRLIALLGRQIHLTEQANSLKLSANGRANQVPAFQKPSPHGEVRSTPRLHHGVDSRISLPELRQALERTPLSPLDRPSHWWRATVGGAVTGIIGPHPVQQLLGIGNRPATFRWTGAI